MHRLIPKKVMYFGREKKCGTARTNRPIHRVLNVLWKLGSSEWWENSPYLVLSYFPSFSFPVVLCGPTDLAWGYGTQFEAMTGRTTFIIHLAEMFLVFLSRKANAWKSVHSPLFYLMITLMAVLTDEMKVGPKKSRLQTSQSYALSRLTSR